MAAGGLVVTISASYGAGGSVVAPRVAEALGLRFIDRAVPAAVVHRLAGDDGRGRAEEGLAPEEPDAHWIRRLVAGAARLPALIGATMPQPDVGADPLDVFKAENETGICEMVEGAGGGGVLLGRGAAAFLGRHPRCVHVRLDGAVTGASPGAWNSRGSTRRRLDEAEARRRQQATDRARALYVRRFYDRDVRDTSLYHLVVDSVAVPLDVCVELITRTARAVEVARPT